MIAAPSTDCVTDVDSDDIELIARVLASDDRHAFAALVHRHQGAVRAFLTRLTRGQRALADDLAQETFIQCFRSLARFRGGSQFRTWLLGIAYNEFRNEARRRHATCALPTDELPPDLAADQETATRSPADASDLRADLTSALATLPPEQQTVIHLCFQEGLSHAEASCVLDWPLGTVKTHLLRAKENLRHHLRAWAPA